MTISEINNDLEEKNSDMSNDSIATTNYVS